ncbi:hypothetical protein [Algibacter lectus]|uniref:Uncharacterized protein n=1 Tax=Algibacter lectus TaxID=221126 RepID=A0A090VKA5_9FLAO|nr:hypothetical protein [Algibacter lectus]GAL65166.1 hypothetical protein JCM19300_846 [Algibacter lectus]
MIKERIEKFKSDFSQDSYIQELVFEEINSQEENFKNPDFLESINDFFI